MLSAFENRPIYPLPGTGTRLCVPPRKTLMVLTLEKLLLQLSLGDFDLNGAVHLLLVAALVVGIVLNGGREKSVDECSLS